MLVTELAMVDMQLRGESLGALLRGLLARLLGRRTAAPQAPLRTPLQLVPSPPARDETTSNLAATAADGPSPLVDFPWRRHPQLLGRDVPDARHSLPERRARVAAVRGMFNARCGDYEAARLAFSDAAREPAVSLADVPGFWHLPRAGMTAAVLAYEDVGRIRDAAALGAEITHRFRPRPLRPKPTRTPRAAASGD